MLRCPRYQNRDFHPTDEDLSVGTPGDLGHPYGKFVAGEAQRLRENARGGAQVAGLPGSGSGSPVFLIHKDGLRLARAGACGGACAGACVENRMLSQAECERPVTGRTLEDFGLHGGAPSRRAVHLRTARLTSGRNATAYEFGRRLEPPENEGLVRVGRSGERIAEK